MISHMLTVGFARWVGDERMRVRSRRSGALLCIVRVPRARVRALGRRAVVACWSLVSRPHPLLQIGPLRPGYCSYTVHILVIIFYNCVSLTYVPYCAFRFLKSHEIPHKLIQCSSLMPSAARIRHVRVIDDTKGLLHNWVLATSQGLLA